MGIAVVLISILVFLGCATYVYLMIYHPEWVGITGRSAHKTIAEHREGAVVDDTDIFSGARTPPAKSKDPQK